MTERDAFDARLADVVHGLADRAMTRVDAVEVAELAMADNATPRHAWLRATLQVPVVVVVVVVTVMLGAVAWSMGNPEQIGVPAMTQPVAPTASPAASPSPTPSPSPSPSPDPLAPAHVTGTVETAVQSPGTTSSVGGVDRTTGIAIATTDAVDDPRASGAGLLRLSVEGPSSLGFVSGSLHLETVQGAWDGNCTGASGDAGPPGHLECWMTGSGSYAGLFYYRSTTTTADGTVLAGMILPVRFPTPSEGQ